MSFRYSLNLLYEIAYLILRTMLLPTKVCVVKAMVFPVKYGCESWTIKKAEY